MQSLSNLPYTFVPVLNLLSLLCGQARDPTEKTTAASKIAIDGPSSAANDACRSARTASTGHGDSWSHRATLRKCQRVNPKVAAAAHGAFRIAHGHNHAIPRRPLGNAPVGPVDERKECSRFPDGLRDVELCEQRTSFLCGPIAPNNASKTSVSESTDAAAGTGYLAAAQALYGPPIVCEFLELLGITVWTAYCQVVLTQ